jgi:Na+-driven multidrug efflux pump
MSNAVFLGTIQFKKTHNSIFRLYQSRKEIIKVIYPNAIKSGLTILGNFFVIRSAIIIGPLYLSLDVMASYGITGQIISFISSVSSVYFSTYQPKLSQYRVQNETNKIMLSYLKSCLFLFCTFISAGMILFFLGDWILQQIGSLTYLLPKSCITVMLLFSLLNANHSIAGNTIMTKNEVPFFSALMLAGCLTIVLLLFLLGYTSLGVWSMILALGIANLYNNWKWPYEVCTQLHILSRDVLHIK